MNSGNPLKEKLLDKPDEQKIKLLSKVVIAFAILIFVVDLFYYIEVDDASFWTMIWNPLFYAATGFLGLNSEQKMQRYAYLGFLCIMVIQNVLDLILLIWVAIGSNISLLLVLLSFLFYGFALVLALYSLKVTWRYHGAS